ncbi:putative gustatory receptor 28b [Schistocerca piceifrons]|uniref:putative gustatory receptor 28b n=1 Tax=Schistocerca piceifrons TaxID=274613 RepID=UPI001F5F83E9|nr:putative gustatory receptor 28b [Schistocerca piceifrons]
MDTEEQPLVSAGNVETGALSSTSTLFEDIPCENVGAGAQEVMPPPTSAQGDVDKEIAPPPEKQEPENAHGKLPEPSRKRSLRSITPVFDEHGSVSRLQTAHCLLRQLARTVGAAYGVQNSAEVTCSFVNIVTNAYIMLAHLLEMEELQSTGQLVLHTLPWIVMAAWRLVCIAHSSDAVVREANHTEQLVNKLLLLSPLGVSSPRSSLQRFVDQLGHSGLRYSAAGLFSIDRSLLASCVAAVTTYLVILVQFGMSSGVNK